MTQVLEFRNEYTILKVELNMDDLSYAVKKIQIGMFAKELGAKEVAITIKDNNEKHYFIGVYNV